MITHISLKKVMKNVVGHMKCKKYSISTGGQTYIGCHENILGGKNIVFGTGVCVRPHVDLWANGKMEVGSGTEIGEGCRISIARSLVIGEKVLISPNVYITDCDHAYENVGIPVMEQGVVEKDNRIVIRDHSYIGINAVIVGNVTIGKGSVIGANSVVTGDVPDYSVAVGAPAKVIKKYSLERKRWERM